MRRKLFNLAAALSLMLSLTCALLWVRSHRVSYFAQWSRSAWQEPTYTTSNLTILCGQGGIGLDFRRSVSQNPSAATLARVLRSDPVGRHFRKGSASTEATFGPTSRVAPGTGQYLGRLMRMTSVWNRLGFVREHYHTRSAFGADDNFAPPESAVRTMERTKLIVGVPLWFSTLIFAVPPALCVVRRLRTVRNTRLGRCPSCGYDLRATPDRCPECGKDLAAANGV